LNVPAYKLAFPEAEIGEWAARYSYADDKTVAQVIGPAAQRKGYLQKPEFEELCEWKSQRIRSKAKRNPEERIAEVTRLALASSDARIKMGLLRILHGVDWATASVILHFCDRSPYPIIDYRAMWSLGLEKVPHYSYEVWESYTEFVRSIAERTGHTMRTVDRALWLS
jgi:hypothetical protein